MFKVSNKNCRKNCEICSKLTVKHQNDIRRSAVFIDNFEHNSHLSVFLLLIEQVSVSWALATVAPSRKIYDSKHGQKAIKTVDTKLCNNIGLFMIGNEALRSMYYFFLRITAVRYGRPNTTSPNQPPGCILSDMP